MNPGRTPKEPTSEEESFVYRASGRALFAKVGVVLAGIAGMAVVDWLLGGSDRVVGLTAVVLTAPFGGAEIQADWERIGATRLIKKPLKLTARRRRWWYRTLFTKPVAFAAWVAGAWLVGGVVGVLIYNA